MYKNIRLLSIVLLYVLLVHCSSDVSEIPQTENEIFNKLLRAAPKTVIDLDGISVDTLFVTEKHTLGKKSSSQFSNPVYLAFPSTSIIEVKDVLYVANQQKIYSMDKEGVWQRSFGRHGEGPGEFDSNLKIASNSTQIFGFDYGNGRIHVFDYELNFISTINKSLYYSPIWRNFTVSDTYLYLGLSPQSNNNLVAVYNTNDLENVVETFWPKIIPNGLQPSAYNNILIDVNKNEIVTITNLGLPYLFLLSPDLKIEHILYFDSSYYEELENPSAQPVNIEGNTEQTVPGVGSFIKHIRVNDDGSLYLTIGNNLYKIIIDETNTYRLNGAWHFVHSDPVLREDNPKGIDIGGMIIEDGVLYFLSLMGGHVFRVPLN